MSGYRTNRKDVLFYEWPGGLKSMAGGERTKIRLNRPWQKMWGNKDKSQCPFCDFSKEDSVTSAGGGWYTKTNKYSIYDVNRIIFPESCWGNDRLYSLGSASQIEVALKIAEKERQTCPNIPLVVSANIGFQAGQNYPHLHYHLQSVFGRKHISKTAEELRRLYKKRQDLVLFDEEISVSVGGVRAGQCFIYPRRSRTAKGKSVSQLASVLYRLVELCKKKFKSTQGLPPDFTVALYFDKGFSYGIYTPIVSNWGGTEYLSLYEKEGQLLLRWPHEITVKYLKNKNSSNSRN